MRDSCPRHVPIPSMSLSANPSPSGHGAPQHPEFSLVQVHRSEAVLLLIARVFTVWGT